jgi:hypothetical protein
VDRPGDDQKLLTEEIQKGLTTLFCKSKVADPGADEVRADPSRNSCES